MPTVKITGWEYGFEKVAFTKLQSNLAKLSLKEAKNNTDDLLEKNIPITLYFVEETVATEFLRLAKSMNAIGHLEN